ncbi:J domain-containing protein [Agromyces kandeliae]|uniref:DnaJ domain-containing protein n=1 Tax=Agromyces kandeliae TaxID=2666141 RepID=A0A6L5QYT5_9MICO|nr:DnaJ domain-containing protein [Agromyces kandeliae]MRX42815.1 DnaJ domain-containing protein [Agromyces kandeliae]
MTPDEAARVLGVDRDADQPALDRAYRRLARELHPDRFVGAPEPEVLAASARFVEVGRAYRLLSESRSDAGVDGASGPIFAQARSPGAARAVPLRPFSARLFATWVALLLLGALLSTSTDPILTPLDLWGRLALLVTAALATGLTRRRWAWWATLVLLGLSGVAVIASTTVASLLGLGFMAVASVGIAVQAGLVRFPDQG